MNSYSLPQQIYEWTGEYGKKLENLRRSLLDLLFSHHFQYVHPPILEYQETLALGSGEVSRNQAFRFIDPISGKMLAIRTDISPQISRLDYALNAQSQTIAKYCYAGEIALARVDSLAIRNPYQVGAEIFGDSSVQADIEILTVALECCQKAKESDFLVDLGHTGILKHAVNSLDLSASQQEQFLDILQRKAIADATLFIENNQLNQQQINIIKFLLECNETQDDIEIIKNNLLSLFPECEKKWQHLWEIFETISKRYPNIKWHIDIAELQGFSYHTGIVFGIYAQQKLICRGGRYNHSSSSNFRTATGFTLDVNSLKAASVNL
jgi:ATP phosphoribosyltransferase regulatory subunit